MTLRDGSSFLPTKEEDPGDSRSVMRMQRTCRVLSACALLLAFAPPPALSQGSADVCRVEARFKGGTPPVSWLYDCVFELEGRPFDKQETQKCLNTMMRSGFFSEGHFDFAPQGKSTTLVFDLTSVPFTLVDIKFEGFEESSKEIQAWLKAWLDGHPGDLLEIRSAYFDSRREFSTYELLLRFLESKWRDSVMSIEREFNTKEHTARVKFRVAEGPAGRSEVLPAAHFPPCSPELNGLDWEQVGDNVPLYLSNNLLTKMAITSCFSVDLVQEQLEPYRKSGLFEKVGYSFASHKRPTQLKLEIQGKPLEVAQIRLEGRGLWDGKDLALPENLPLKVGDLYSGRRSYSSREFLRQAFGGSGLYVKVAEVDTLTGAGKVEVTYYVLAVEGDSTIVDGTLTKDLKEPRERHTCP